MGIKAQEEAYKLYLEDGIWDSPKILRNPKEVLNILDGAVSKPLHVTIDSIEVCNQRCQFCYYHCKKGNTMKNSTFNGNQMIPFDRLINLIAELKESGTEAISFTGTGETLLYPNIYNIFQRIIDNEMEFGLTTNLNVKISDSDIDILSKSSWIRCSLNATDEKIYNRIHRPISGNLNQVLDNIGLLSNINISYVITDNNIHDIVKTTKIVKDLGVNSIFFRLEMTFNDKRKKITSLNKIKSKLEEAKKIESNSFKVYSIHDNIKTSEDLLCYYSNHIAYIDAYGDVYPCCVVKCDKRFIYGNIMNRHFKEFWNSEKRKENYKKINMKTCPPCIHHIDNLIFELLYNRNKIFNRFI